MKIEAEVRIIVDGLKENFSSFRDNVWKLSGLGIIAIGWLMTSETAQDFLSNHFVARVILICTFFLAGLSHTYVNFTHYKKSKLLITALKNRVAEEVYGSYVISPSFYVLNALIVNFVMATGIVMTTLIGNC